MFDQNRRQLLTSVLTTCGLSISDAQPFAEKLEAAAEGNEVLECQMAMLCCMFYNAHRKQSVKMLRPEDFLPRRVTPKEAEADRRKMRAAFMAEAKRTFGKEITYV